MLTRTISTIVASLLALLALAGAARAGRYHVYSCRTPGGAPAPADGWSGSQSGSYTYVRNTCSEPNGSLLAALGDQPIRRANEDAATWLFTAPTGAQIVGATVWRAGDADGGAGINAWFQFALAGSTPAQVFERCAFIDYCTTGQGDVGQPFAAPNEVVVPTANLGTNLYATAACTGPQEPEAYECPAGKGDPSGYAAAIYLYAADITLEQSAGPSVSGVGGELATAATVAGTSPLLFDASDPGSGVYEVVFSVDGRVVQTDVPDENGGRCRDVGETSDGLSAFLYLQPCKTFVSADVGFDTASVANGSHHLVVSVLDAAGNAAPVLDRTITIANPPPPGAPNGINASARAKLSVAWQGAKGARLLSAYGRAHTLEGRLTDEAGAPIADAQIELTSTPAGAGAAAGASSSLATDGDGRFALRLPRESSSRTLRFTYRAHVGDAAPAAQASLTLTVRAGLSLAISPKTAHVGSTIYFRGRLLGKPVPRGGKQLVLEARAPGGSWIVFDVIRAGARGAFHARYRFKFPGPATYQFRVRSESEADYPFAAGSSNVVTVHEH